MASEDFNSARLHRYKTEAQFVSSMPGLENPAANDDKHTKETTPSATEAKTDTTPEPEAKPEEKAEVDYIPPKGSQVYNFLWLNLDMPPKDDPEDGTIREPLKPRYVKNVRDAALANPATDVFLWVDSKRLTEKQMAFLQETLEEDIPNVKLKDLRSIPAYNDEPLYNSAENSPNWRNGGQTSTIWRQVDSAKILITLQGDYDQSFFADIDHSHLAINSKKVQGMLEKHGLMIGASSEYGHSVENQLWGTTRSRRPFFESYYVTALKSAYRHRNAWEDLVDKVKKELNKKEGIANEEIILSISGDGTSAEHTGHEFRDGYNTSMPAVVDKGELARVFNKRSVRPPRESLAVETTWAPSVRVDPTGARVSGWLSRAKEAIGLY